MSRLPDKIYKGDMSRETVWEFLDELDIGECFTTTRAWLSSYASYSMTCQVIRDAVKLGAVALTSGRHLPKMYVRVK
jgi:hypothetical protein